MRPSQALPDSCVVSLSFWFKKSAREAVYTVSCDFGFFLAKFLQKGGDIQNQRHQAVAQNRGAEATISVDGRNIANRPRLLQSRKEFDSLVLVHVQGPSVQETPSIRKTLKIWDFV